MQYVLFIHLDQKSFASQPKEDQNRVHRECSLWHEELVKSGRSIGAFALQPTDTSTTLRSQDGKIVVTDGPFIETKEVLGGFEILECRDLDEALAIAKRFPNLGEGCSLEVRPLIVGKCGD